MKKIKNTLWSLSLICLTGLLFTSCEKYDFEEPIVEIPNLYTEWRLVETEHTYIDVNEIGMDSDTTWNIYNGSTYIAMETNLSFDLVTPGETEWDITEGMVVVDGDGAYNINGQVYPSPDGSYPECWDLNGNGQQDHFEDINGNGVCDIFDCGPEGIIIGVYNTVRVFNIKKLTSRELYLEFEGQYFEDFDYYTTTLKFERIYK